ncbi:MAG: hypothetical protein ACK5PP_01835 [Acidimicrobiales bacterium]
MTSTRTPAAGAAARRVRPARPILGIRARPFAAPASIEFFVVLSILIVVIVGVLTYGALRGRQQVMAFAATDAALVAAGSSDDPTTLVDERVEVARAAVAEALAPVERSCDPVGSSGGFSCVVSVVTCPNEPALSCVDIELTHDNGTHPVVPLISPLADLTPDILRAGAVAVVSGGS